MYGSKREIQVLTCLAYKFWIKAFSTSRGRQSPGTLQKMVDVTMMSLCRRTLKVTVHWIPILQKFLWVFPFLLSFSPVSQKIGGKNSPGLVGSTDCLWPLHWRIHCPGTGGSFVNRKHAPESFFETHHLGDFWCIDRKDSWNPVKRLRFFLRPVHSRSTHCHRKISYCSPGCFF